MANFRHHVWVDKLSGEICDECRVVRSWVNADEACPGGEEAIQMQLAFSKPILLVGKPFEGFADPNKAAKSFKSLLKHPVKWHGGMIIKNGPK